MTLTMLQAIHTRTETALVMGAKLADVYALAVAIEDHGYQVEPETKADSDSATIRPGAK